MELYTMFMVLNVYYIMIPVKNFKDIILVMSNSF